MDKSWWGWDSLRPTPLGLIANMNREKEFVEAVKHLSLRMDKARREDRAGIAIRLALEIDPSTLPPNGADAAKRFVDLMYRVRIMPRL